MEKLLAPVREQVISKRADIVGTACRKYSVLHLSLLFFGFASIGWVWEVALDLWMRGELVNRGMSYGPWLPIYGVVGIALLLLLRPWLRRPGLALGITFIATGIIEFSASWLLEAATGKRWWDYTGYFLSIDGRVCFTALVFFCIGGMAVVYLLAPKIDSLLNRLSKRTKVAAISTLGALFVADLAYSLLIAPNVNAII